MHSVQSLRSSSENSTVYSLNSFTATGDFANSVDPEETVHNEPSHQDLRCLTFSLSAYQINFFPINSLLKNKANDKCSLKFGVERVNGT